MTLVFVLGSHRTGTKLLANYFDKYYSEVNSIHQYSQMRKTNIMSNLRLYGLISEAKYIKYLKENWFPILESNKNSPVYLESNGFNFLAVKYARQYFDDVRVIHAVREPKSYAISHANWVRSKWKSYVANNVLPFWNLKAPLLGEMSWLKWFKLSLLEKKIWHWSYKNRFIEDLYSDTQNYIVFKLEDIVNKTTRINAVESIVSFCGLEMNTDSLSFFEKKQNQSIVKKITVESFEKTVSEEFFVEYCGELNKKYGYL